MKWSGFSKTVVILSVMIAIFTISIVPTFAQDDDRIDPRPGDRIAVYCQTTTLDVYGVDNQSRGVFLAAFTYGDLFRLGSITFNTSNGQVTAGVNAQGVFFARWNGGPVNATGVGDFFKTFNCPSSFYTPPTIPSVVGGNPVVQFPYPANPQFPTYPSQSDLSDLVTYDVNGQTVVIQQTATNTGSGSIDQSVIFQQGTGTLNAPANTSCGSRTYTVRTGDNLFRIAIRFGTNVHTLAACNGIADPSRIFVGQVIHVP